MFCVFESLYLHSEPELGLLRWEWRGPLTADNLRSAFEQLLVSSQQCRTTGWLADVAHMPLVSIDEQAWLSDVWLPQFAALPVRTVALLLPISQHNQLVLESILADGRRHVRLEVQFFSDIPAALDWLTNSAVLAGQLEHQWSQAHPGSGSGRVASLPA